MCGVDQLLWFFVLFFFFNDTATTEIYTRKDTFPYTTLFRSPLPGRQSWTLRRSPRPAPSVRRSEEHTSELQSPFLISYAVFCLKKKTHTLIVLLHHPFVHKHNNIFHITHQ